MTIRNTRAYISGPLHGVSDLESSRRFYLRLARVCEECGIAAYVPHQSSDPELHHEMPNEEVFENDFHELMKADIVIAYIGQASSGVGAELGIAFENDKQIVGVYQEDQSPSRFILGMLSRTSSILIKYNDHAQCESLLKQCLVNLNQKANIIR